MKNVLNRKLNKKGFTLAELLVVVAIIAVLVAIAIPIFSAVTDRAERAVELANARACYAQGMAKALGTNNAITAETLSAGGKIYTFACDAGGENGKVTVDAGSSGKTVYAPSGGYTSATFNAADAQLEVP